MAYSATYDPADMDSPKLYKDGRRIWTIEITQAEVNPAVAAQHEWSLEVPNIITILEHIVEVTDDNSGAVTEVAPELGVASEWTADTSDQRLAWDWGVDTPGLYAASFEQRTISVPGGSLYGRAVPDAAGGTIKTTITFVEGVA